MDAAAARRAWTSFRGTSPGVRAFLAARLAVLPLGGLDDDLRALRGRVLSLGSGYGVFERYVAELNPHVTIEGVELDRRRVDAAAATAEHAPRVSIRAGDVTRLEDRGYDAALAIDVFHHLAAPDHTAVARALVRALRPGGVCLVKDIGVTPAWKSRWNLLHDRLVAGPGSIECRAPDEMAAVFEPAGFGTRRIERLDRWSPYPHYLLVLERQAGALSNDRQR